MARKILFGVAVAIVVAAAVHIYTYDRGKLTTAGEYSGLARSVTGNALVSKADPAVAMHFDPSFRYLGGQKFILYGVADTEQHFFVQTTASDRLNSVYWIQFEAYRSDNRHTYDYDDSPARLQLGDYDFYVDTAPVQSDPNRKRRRGTDGARAREFLHAKGYAFPQDYAYARLVHLTDESRRKELMVIFIEDLAPLGLKGSDLREGGPAADRWPAIERRHLERIRDTMRLAVPGS